MSGNSLEALLDRAERELHDAYWDSDNDSDAETTRQARHNMRMEWLADADDHADFAMEFASNAREAVRQ